MLKCCLGEVKPNEIYLYASTGDLSKFNTHEVNIYPNGEIIYYKNGYPVQDSAECDELMEKFFTKTMTVIV